jgi:gamma-glutamyl-gamma-aminobutyrate hydrolase PuuD
MKNIAVIQRVEFIEKRNEYCDALDQSWTDLLLSINLFPVFLPNNVSYVKKFIKIREINGLLISGGGSLTKYNGSSSERDAIEKIMINFSITKNIPVLGVCRGMQSIQNHFGNDIQIIKNHVKKRHSLNVLDYTKV